MSFACEYCKDSEFRPTVGVFAVEDGQVYCEEHGLLSPSEYEVIE